MIARTLFSSEGLTGKDLLPHSHVCWQHSVSAGCQTEDLSFLLTVSQRLSSPLHYVTLFIVHLTIWKLFFFFFQASKKESLLVRRALRITVLCNIIMELTTCLLCHIILDKSKFLHPHQCNGMNIRM